MEVTLIRSVIDALPTHMMFVFPMLTNVIDKLDAIRRNLLWQENCDPLGSSQSYQIGRGSGDKLENPESKNQSLLEI